MRPLAGEGAGEWEERRRALKKDLTAADRMDQGFQSLCLGDGLLAVRPRI